jgi:hypothetical protein
MTEGSVSQAAVARSRILYNKDRCIAVCVSCQQCIVPGDGIKRHLKEHHRDWPLALRKEIITYCAGLSLLKPEEVQYPTDIPQPIGGLAYHEGWKCEMCGYCCVSEDSIIEHHKQLHKWTKRQGPQWRAASVQTMFVGLRKQYFEVVNVKGERQADREDLGVAIERLLDEGKKLDQAELKSAAQTGDEQLPSDNTL